MELYLVRHAKAEAGPDDDVRRLSERGREAAETMARWLKRNRIEIARIEHSGLVRARQTAEAIAHRIEAPLVEVADLRPESDVQTVRTRLLTETAPSLMLVGHNPFMEILSGLLLAEDAELRPLTFHTASVARLVASGPLAGRFGCDWLVTPSLVG